MISTVYLIMAILVVGIMGYMSYALGLWEIFENIFDEPKSDTSFEAGSYSHEDITLAEFLEAKQAINEDFLACQKALLEELNRSNR